MGFNTVAVLYNDTIDMGRHDIALGERIYRAVIGWHDRGRQPSSTDIFARNGNSSGSYGQVISQAHADYTQIVAVGGNTGRPIQDCNDLDYMALSAMAECLIRHGWIARQPVRKRKRAA